MGLPKAEFLTPSPEQIERLRSDFFDRLNRDGAPCEGSVFLFFFHKCIVHRHRVFQSKFGNCQRNFQFLFSTHNCQLETAESDFATLTPA